MTTIYRGDNTGAFGNDFLRIYLNNPNNVEISKAVVQINNDVEKTFENPVFPIRVNFSGMETEELQQQNFVRMAVWDSKGKRRTAEGKFSFLVKENRIMEPDSPYYEDDDYDVLPDYSIQFDLTDTEFAAQFSINATPSNMSELVNDIKLLSPDNVHSGENVRIEETEDGIRIHADADIVTDYNDLEAIPTINGKPLKGDLSLEDFNAQPDWEAESGPSSILNKPEFARVAITGDFSDIIGKPFIPSKISDLNDDIGILSADTTSLTHYVLKEEVIDYINESDAIHQLSNALGYTITRQQLISSLTAYVTKSELADEMSTKVSEAFVEEYVSDRINELMGITSDIREVLNEVVYKEELGKGVLRLFVNDTPYVFGANNSSDLVVSIHIPQKISDLQDDLGLITEENLNLSTIATKEELTELDDKKLDKEDFGNCRLVLTQDDSIVGEYQPSSEGVQEIEIPRVKNLSELHDDVGYVKSVNINNIDTDVADLKSAKAAILSTLSDMQSDIAGKISETEGYGLVSNAEIERLRFVTNYNDEPLQTRVSILEDKAQSLLSNKVDKEEGKGLSSNDYTDEDRNAVANVRGNLSDIRTTIANLDDYIDELNDKADQLVESDNALAERINTEISNRASEVSLLADSINVIKTTPKVITVLENKEQLLGLSIAFTEGDIVKVLSDETNEDNITYYRYTDGAFVKYLDEKKPYSRDAVDSLFVKKDLKINNKCLTEDIYLTPLDIGLDADYHVGNGNLTVYVGDKLQHFEETVPYEAIVYDDDGIPELDDDGNPKTVTKYRIDVHDSFNANSKTDRVIKFELPKVSELENDAEYISLNGGTITTIHNDIDALKAHDITVDADLGDIADLIQRDAEGVIVKEEGQTVKATVKETLDNHEERIQELKQSYIDNVGLTEWKNVTRRPIKISDILLLASLNPSNELDGVDIVTSIEDEGDSDAEKAASAYERMLRSDYHFVAAVKALFDKDVLSDYLKVSNVKNKVSELENDRGYVTANAIGKGVLSFQINNQVITNPQGSAVVFNANDKNNILLNIPLDTDIDTKIHLTSDILRVGNQDYLIRGTSVFIYDGHEPQPSDEVEKIDDKPFRIETDSFGNKFIYIGSTEARTSLIAPQSSTVYGEIKRVDDSAVHQDLIELITGDKTFDCHVIVVDTGMIEVPTRSLENKSKEAANTEWCVDYADLNLVHKTNNVTEEITGLKTFKHGVTFDNTVTANEPITVNSKITLKELDLTNDEKDGDSKLKSPNKDSNAYNTDLAIVKEYVPNIEWVVAYTDKNSVHKTGNMTESINGAKTFVNKATFTRGIDLTELDTNTTTTPSQRDDNTDRIPNTRWVNTFTETHLVHKTGNKEEDITGHKLFSNAITAKAGSVVTLNGITHLNGTTDATTSLTVTYNIPKEKSTLTGFEIANKKLVPNIEWVVGHLDDNVIHKSDNISEVVTGLKQFQLLENVESLSLTDDTVKPNRAATIGWVRNYTRQNTLWVTDNLAQQVTGEKTFVKANFQEVNLGNKATAETKGLNVPFSTNVATTAFVNNYFSDKESYIVHNVGNESIGGDKTLSGTTYVKGNAILSSGSFDVIEIGNQVINGQTVAVVTRLVQKSNINGVGQTYAPTQHEDDNSNKVATTAFVKNQDYAKNSIMQTRLSNIEETIDIVSEYTLKLEGNVDSLSSKQQELSASYSSARADLDALQAETSTVLSEVQEALSDIEDVKEGLNADNFVKTDTVQTITGKKTFNEVDVNTIAITNGTSSNPAKTNKSTSIATTKWVSDYYLDKDDFTSYQSDMDTSLYNLSDQISLTGVSVTELTSSVQRIQTSINSYSSKFERLDNISDQLSDIESSIAPPESEFSLTSTRALQNQTITNLLIDLNIMKYDTPTLTEEMTGVLDIDCSGNYGIITTANKIYVGDDLDSLTEYTTTISPTKIRVSPDLIVAFNSSSIAVIGRDSGSGNITSLAVNDIAVGDNIVAVGNGNTYTSLDGSSWTTNATGLNITKVKYFDDKFVGLVGNKLYSSLDGETWTTLITLSENILDFNKSHILVGTKLYNYESEVINVSSSTCFDDSDVFILSGGSKTYYSDNGTTWKELNIVGSKFIYRGKPILLTNDNKLVSFKHNITYVQGVDDASVVHKTGNESISGVKTFTDVATTNLSVTNAVTLPANSSTTTPDVSDNSTKIATTKWVKDQGYVTRSTFIATYGSTSYSDIASAINNGQAVVCKAVDNGTTYYGNLVSFNSSLIVFQYVSESDATNYQVTSANAWSLVVTPLGNRPKEILPLASSGEVSVETNKVYKITPNGSVTFKLPAANTLDNSVLNQIMIQLNLTALVSINPGTTYFFNEEEVDLSDVKMYNILYEFDSNKQVWVMGSMPKGTDAGVGCVLYDTKILMSDNSIKDAQNVNVGDLVRTYNESTKSFEDNKVLKVMANNKDDIIKVTLADGRSIRMTSGHPTLTENGWASFDNDKTRKENLYDGAELHKLEVGNKILTEHGYVEVISITTENIGTVRVYDYVVDKAHTFIGDGMVLHNGTVTNG